MLSGMLSARFVNLRPRRPVDPQHRRQREEERNQRGFRLEKRQKKKIVYLRARRLDHRVMPFCIVKNVIADIVKLAIPAR